MQKSKFETKYRFVTEFKLGPVGHVTGEQFRVQYRPWYFPFWKDIGLANSAEQIQRLINLHKKRVTYL